MHCRVFLTGRSESCDLLIAQLLGKVSSMQVCLAVDQHALEDLLTLKPSSLAKQSCLAQAAAVNSAAADADATAAVKCQMPSTVAVP